MTLDDPGRAARRAGPGGDERPLSAPAAPPALTLSGAGKRYGQREALQPLSLAICAGERVAVVGPSGAGKSTLLRLLATSLAPSCGSVAVLGHDVAALSPRALRRLRARIGTVHQQLHLVPQASVMQNVVAGRLGRVSLARALASLVSREEAARVAAVLAEVGIAGRLHDRVDRLSGGEQQRVAIARALYQDPEIALADEPIASVDPTRASELAALLARAFAGRTLVVTTHRLEPLLPVVTRVVGLRDGALAFDKPTAALTLDDLSRLYASRRGAPAPRSPTAAPAAAASPAAPAGVLALGASNTPGEFVLPRALRAFVRDHPGVRVSLAVKDSAEVTADLLAGRIEVGFVGARSPHPELHYEDLVEDEIVLVASPALEGISPEPISPADAARLPRVEREAGSGTRVVVEEHLANLGVPLDPAAVALEVGTLAGLKAAVLSGVGVAFTSRLAVREELEHGHLRVLRLEGVRIPRRLFVAWRRGAAPSPAARRFVEVARASLAHAAGRA
ncbi:LysR substrate-binding domain-containing protein [Anaeromyxobacter sp. Fw109-5]|uniref:LysR substrate-binding domain-containing protein n=1 Tax=Anaeromyxobacter sp. (strain Fw109-5) TaxID=404589 RepID=UPI0000ED8A86|nr:LysR substrate-binding domain-containing protein [Anaeromyxobacter sp. Fw109-5]ABS27216.1 ABC transporter related [Anaeromyxobacter sp. Fw109-5]